MVLTPLWCWSDEKQWRHSKACDSQKHTSLITHVLCSCTFTNMLFEKGGRLVGLRYFCLPLSRKAQSNRISPDTVLSLGTKQYNFWMFSTYYWKKVNTSSLRAPQIYKTWYFFLIFISNLDDSMNSLETGPQQPIRGTSLQQLKVPTRNDKHSSPWG